MKHYYKIKTLNIAVNLKVNKSTGEIDNRDFNCRPGDVLTISDAEDPEVIKIEFCSLPKSLFYKFLSRFFRMRINILLNTKPVK